MRAAVAIKRNRAEDGVARRPTLPAKGGDWFTERRSERAIEFCDCLIDIMSALFNIPSREVREGGRTSRDATRVRQLAMYVAHVTLRLSMKEVALGFARDRTTVLYACHLIEDLRDDPDFDRVAGLAERIASAAFKTRLETGR